MLQQFVVTVDYTMTRLHGSDPMIELTLFVLLHGYTKEIYEEGGKEWKENKECTWSQ